MRVAATVQVSLTATAGGPGPATGSGGCGIEKHLPIANEKACVI